VSLALVRSRPLNYLRGFLNLEKYVLMEPPDSNYEMSFKNSPLLELLGKFALISAWRSLFYQRFTPDEWSEKSLRVQGLWFQSHESSSTESTISLVDFLMFYLEGTLLQRLTLQDFQLKSSPQTMLKPWHLSYMPAAEKIRYPEYVSTRPCLRNWEPYEENKWSFNLTEAYAIRCVSG